MALSRRRERELKKLRKEASQVLHEQKEVLDHANTLLRSSGQQLSAVAKEDVAPQVRGFYEDRVKPPLVTSLATSKAVVDTTRERITRDVVPALAGVVRSAQQVIELAKDDRVRQAAGKLVKGAKPAAVTAAASSKGIGVGGYILIGVGAVAVATVAYATWQTLRADEDLWITSEDDDLLDVVNDED